MCCSVSIGPNVIPLASLVVAALAVFVGPYVSSRIARRQIVAPIRQQWIDKLRDTIAELAAKAAHYWASGYEERSDAEYFRITELQHKLRLLVNAKEEDHALLLKRVDTMVDEIDAGNSKKDKEFWDAHEEVMLVAQQILKREWERVKNEI